MREKAEFEYKIESSEGALGKKTELRGVCFLKFIRVV